MKGIIDIGSNTIRMLIGRLQHTGTQAAVIVDSQHLRTTRLGHTQTGGHLDKKAVERTIVALKEFKEILQQKQVAEPPIVAATSAVREAVDQTAFAARIQQELGWQLRILSGKEEAVMSYWGAAGPYAGQAVVIDVGGGSTELVWQEPTGGIHGNSAKVGAVRLHHGQVSVGQLPQILLPLVAGLPQRQNNVFIGVGGTITTLAAIKKNLLEYSRNAISGTEIFVEEIKQLRQQMAKLSIGQRQQKYPILQERADIILAGMDIYLVLAELAGFDRLIISDAGLLDGLLLETAN